MALSVAAWPAASNRREQPYNWLLYGEVARRGVRVEEFSYLSFLCRRYDILHVHWPDGVVNTRSTCRAIARLLAMLVVLAIARLRRTRIVWTVHNLRSHDGWHPNIERLLWLLIAQSAAATISLSEAGRDQVFARYPCLAGRPGAVIRHGHYRAAYPPALTRVCARQRLGLPDSAPIIAFLGTISLYKNVPGLLTVFRDLGDDGARLVIAGRPSDDAIGAEVRRLAAPDSRVILRLGHVDDVEVPVVLGAADLVVLPYQDILNSGSAILALSYCRPVLAPAIGAMSELRDRAGIEWVQTYAGPLTGEVLGQALAWSRQRKVKPPDPEACPEWRDIAGQTVELYLQALDSNGNAAQRSG